MSVIPRRIIRQDLDLVRVFVEDVENEYIVVQDLPDTFSQGRNAFKVFGSDFLKQGVNLKFEILDSQGNPVFISPIKYRFNNGFPTLPYVYVGVEVYRPPINFGGDAELVILGELDENKVPFNIPDEFVGTYNVRFSKRINLDVSKIINDAPILFYRKPSIIAQEVVKKRLDSSTITTSTVERTISGSGISGFSNRNTLPQEYFPNPANTTQTDTGSAQTGTSDTNTQEYIADIKDGPGGDITETLNRIEFKTGKVKTPTVFRRRSGIALFASEQPPTMVIRATGSGTFTSDMVGSKIKIPKESMTVFAPKQFVGDGNVGIGTGFGSFPSNLALAGGDSNLENAAVFVDDYTGSIERVVNEKEIHTKEPFYFRYGSGNDTRFFLADFGNHPYVPENVPGSPRANFTMSFTDTITDTTSSFAFDSFVDLTIKNARTFSGDVYKIRISGGSQTQVSDFPVLLETVLESPELLVDTLSPSGVLRSGYFQSQAHINKYFNTTGSNTTATSDSTTFIDGMKLSGSYSEHKTNASFGLDTPYAFRVDKDVVYELSMRVFGKKGPKKQADGTTKQEAKIFFHLSGSNLAGETKAKYNGAGDFGTTITDQDGNKVGLSIGDGDPSEVNYEKVSHAFTVPFKLDRLANTDTRFFIRVESGEWIIQDLSLKPALDTGFSPDQFKVRVPIPPNSQRPDRFEFIVNYYNPEGVEAEEITSIRDVDVQGQALLIQADDNLVKGTVTIGNVQGEGIEIKGGNSAFIRSVPFKGFISASQHQVGGFFIWSGSVSPGGVSADGYTGAGLEIHDGNTGDDESFFKFRTIDPDNNYGSTFDVKTSRFFLGQSNTQFVSGSLGNLEISSSNFHLTPEGNITASNFLMNSGVITDTVQILGSVSANSILTPASIGGSPSNVLNASSSISSQGFAKFVSASIAGFIVNTEEIKSSNETLRLKASGQITGSDVLFDGGTIGGFTLTANAISGSNILISSDGNIQTSNFATRLKGFRISGADDGVAEFESIRVRGTLATSVFEKETVNAVGGRLYVANSTAISGSVASDDTAIKVQNASGFEVGEIIFAKKVTGTGFSKEFMKITSTSRQDASDDTDFTGFLHVERGFGGPDTGSAITDSGTDLNGSITKTQTSLVVDGNDARELDKRMIQIDSELMVVSGSPSATILQVHRGVDGTAKATHANNADIKVLDKDSAFLFGLVSPKQSYTDGQVLVSTGRYISGTGTNTVGSGFIELNANPTTGQTPFIEMVERTGSGIYDMERRLVLGDLSGFVGSSIGNRVSLPNNPGFGLASENVFLSGLIQASSGSIGGIKMESNKVFTGTGTHGNSNTGFFADDSGNFSLGSKFKFTNSSGELRVTGSNVVLETNKFFLGKAGSQFISGSNNLLEISSSKFHLQNNGDVTMSGEINASGGTLGGFTISDTKLFSNQSTEFFEILSNPSSLVGEIRLTAVDIEKAQGFHVKYEATGGNQGVFFHVGDSNTRGSRISLDNRGSTDDLLISGSNFELNNGNITLDGVVKAGAIGNRAVTITSSNLSQYVSSNVLYLDGSQGGSTATFARFNVAAEIKQIVVNDSGEFDSAVVVLEDASNGLVLATTGGSGNNKINIDSTSAFAPENSRSSNKLRVGARLGSGTRVLLTRSASDWKVHSLERESKGNEGFIKRSAQLVLPTGSATYPALSFGTTNEFHNGFYMTSNNIRVVTNNSDNFVFTSDGGFRTPNGSESTPGLQLGSADDGFYHLTSGDAGINVLVNNVQEFLFADGGGFHADGDITAFSATTDSDIRLKENIIPLENNLKKVLQLKPSSFRWKIQDKENDIGLIAQDVEKVIPELVKEKSSIGKTKELLDGDKHKTVDYSKITTLLIGAVQEQQKQIDELKKKLEES